MLIGIDVGGTKTQAVLFGDDGSIIKEVKLPSAHPMCAQDDEIMSILQQCMLDETSDVVIGYAGYGKSETMRQHIESVVSTALKDRHVVILSDIETALFSTLEDRDGITLILGTGSIALQRNNGAIERRGGWGYMLGDEGSGYAIGLAILRHFVLQADHRAEKDELYQAVMNHYHLSDPSQLIETIMDHGKPDRTLIASASIISSSFSHHPVIRNILHTSAIEVYEMIQSFHNDSETIVITGGMLHNSAYMEEIRHLLPQVLIATHPQVYGCYVYGRFHHMI